MGIILSALAAAGDDAVRSIDSNIKQSHALDLQQQASDLAAQKAERLATFNSKLGVDTANQQREALNSRSQVTDDQVKGIIAQNAQNKFDYTTDTDKTRATFDQLQDEDQTNPDFKPSQIQLMTAQAANLYKTGDFDAADRIMKAIDADKITLGYGGKVVSGTQKDENGDPVVLGDNSVGRTEAAAANAAARQTSADASKARAGRPGGSGAFDQQLTSLKNDIASNTSQLGIAQRALEGTNKPDERRALQGRIDTLNGQIGDLQKQTAARRAQIAKGSTSSAAPAASSVAPGAAAPSGKNFSNLWE